ncbi:hypothetical protein [Campylobacter hyointestinalis]|uniref:hypothetical protein n=1 Tax=Campylobacter hyointestinalis TaxID=198 RepID=UPI000CE3B567|nr:hypothetical protein [Campylobacter hyointestinalis]PPB51195.1 hypothetical protein CDQ68_08550 [Campylobacter hyointestinalis subsp. hyointestinalis]PPB65619.1 hypothetical protein CDQ75_08950 [Campylobacter hyointestinalis subsp. hyointestinalis]PPB68046.1 hypothetical protein CDQ77_08490 [Campylobacter hyointestinalis subsp. hyointestinalis]
MDEAKERLGFLKFWLGVFVAIFIGLVSWIATNYTSFKDDLVFYGACVCAIVCLICIIFGNRYAMKILKEIRDLKEVRGKK